MMTSKPETKNIVGDVVNRLINFFNIEGFKTSIRDFLQQQFNNGIEDVGIKLNMNFVPTENINFLADYAQKNLNQHTDKLGNDLRKEISLAILNNESKPKLVARIKNVFQDKKFENRLKTVIRTEGLRANNAAQMDGAKQSGLNPDKYLDVTLDSVTSNICLAEHKKYGDPNKSINLDQEFVVRVKQGKKTITVRGQHPPFHVNCRTTLDFKRKEEQ